MTEVSIMQLCSIILTRLGFQNESPFTLLEKWKGFVQQCFDGYSWDYSEYLNEIRARSLIQHLLDDERIANSDELSDLFSEVSEVDRAFKTLLKTDVVLNKGEHWWETGVLRKAGEEYCQYMFDAHQISVDNTEV